MGYSFTPGLITRSASVASRRTFCMVRMVMDWLTTSNTLLSFSRGASSLVRLTAITG